ncbi:helix-turn-helix domain-containing protein [Phormidesmis sp. 146-33]
MKFSEALNQTLNQFKISGNEIANLSGIRAATISEYRRGVREIHTDNLERLIAALPSEAKQFLFLHLLVGQMDDEGIATLLSAISNRMRQEKVTEQRIEPELQLAS